jgi:acid phosphatase (class A)
LFGKTLFQLMNSAFNVNRHLAASFRLGVFFILLALAGPALQAKDLHYLAAGQPDFLTLLPPPPLTGSSEQATDMAAVVALHKACSTNDAEIAFSEKKFSIATFAPALGVMLEDGHFPKTEAFFKHVQTDAAVVTDTAKDYWKRPRPFTVDPSLGSGKLEKSFGYPSGHSTEATVLALVLADLFPDKREEVLTIGRNIGWHRVWIARHYPTDIYAGRVLAQAIVKELKSSPDFQKDIAEVKSEIATAKPTAKPAVEMAQPAAVAH